MREPTSKNQVCSFRSGQRITGRWHGNQYLIVRLLGEGAIGKVYLAKKGVQSVAIKVARESMSISSEVRALRQVSKVQGISLGPFFIDMDDVSSSSGTTSFYVMEYIEGEPFLPFLKSRGNEWMALFLVQLLGDLANLHKAGWVFGDLKPENLIVSHHPFSLRWIDVGGMTKLGRSIKEYTEFFDRGYWGIGDRKAEASYDLFSVAMLMLNRGYFHRFEKTGLDGRKQLVAKVKQQPVLDPFSSIICKGIEHRYDNALEMKRDLLDVLQKEKKRSALSRVKKKKLLKQSKKVHSPSNQVQTTKEKKYRGLYETLIFASFLLLLYILYLVG
ncbi:serine/threonine protein kinase [Salipaludibacillus daqingensis]|uniref:serine/threonine protein kinase n=1 Tax=Salipaludibacillus daqingensis TaxID=3041001 RepID=UPI0024731DBB|nr:serine/threonine-protein kinase [Salipaludibacillus daqingensis]